ncbi:MAG: glycosyltransferase, partial [Nonlabens ulvanivorans]
MSKVSLSAIVPAYNEAHNIVEVLKSVDFCDEVILVDSNSTDNTIELAQPYITKLLTREYVHSAS